MNWLQAWDSLSARILSLVDAGRFVMGGHSSGDPWGAYRELMGNAISAFRFLERFRDMYSAALPPGAASRLKEFTERYSTYFRDELDNTSDKFHGMRFMVAVLASFRSEFEHLLADREAKARTLVDRAFLHLQRSIVVDTSFSDRWQKAFDKGEVACEKLGGVQLLLFGIYSFKVDTAGERTDLVLGQKLAVSEAESASEALVLTEWKLVRNSKDLDSIANRAFEQAKRYSAGSLAGFELATCRYLVIVSEEVLTMPQIRTDQGVLYHFKNVAVRPESPSVPTPNSAA